ncbi:15-cis-zeta-carotene isomerase, chloroplastic [Morella rubra]|uniref:15-cis-zeta-carotene isomerase, chloroplastic n=1 Tax=Morella rubra TaxID=262757 RepID=A0A6A1VE83_9ROSI|nr:15-cis-zeta-carotene isomerase, chloroplastic [Morella rubra]
MATSLVLSNTFSPLPHRPNGNKRAHLLRWASSTPKTLLRPPFNPSLHNSALAPRPNSLLLLPRKFQLTARTSTGDADAKSSTDSDEPLVVVVGEDSASFDLAEQKMAAWIYFSLILGVVLFLLNFAWIDNSTGLGQAFVHAVSGLSDSHEVVMLTLILIFAIVHSGLASLRDVGEKLIGERAYRVLFAGTSLPLAVSTVVYFINHRYDGLQLWQLQNIPGVHQFVWLSSFISFFFLYPSTFNLLEVAAVEKPQMHLWETGIMRITRHPQMVGQVVWCLAHSIWIGNSVAVAASLGLIGHHLFGVWNGDRRLALRYGEAFDVVKSRTSIIPFAAILDGRQKLPKQYYKEFIRVPYLTITALTVGAYFAHPLMQAASFRLHW